MSGSQIPRAHPFRDHDALTPNRDADDDGMRGNRPADRYFLPQYFMQMLYSLLQASGV
jgi:hypothetical protein